MRIFYDTSVLIAGIVASHPKHPSALSWLQRAKAKKNSMLISGHSLAECFAVLTKLPLSPRLSPDTAHYLLRENIEKLAQIISLSSQDYLAVLKQMAELNLSGGIIYDALAVKAAHKAKADKILTFNSRDFMRLSKKDPSFILVP